MHYLMLDENREMQRPIHTSERLQRNRKSLQKSRTTYQTASQGLSSGLPSHSRIMCFDERSDDANKVFRMFALAR